MTVRARWMAAAVLGLIVVAGLIASTPEGPDYEAIRSCTMPAIAPAPVVHEVAAEASFDLQRVSELAQGTALEPWDATRFLVGTRVGEVWLVDPPVGEETLLLDLTKRTVLNAEGGLLGLAREPDGSHLYVHVTDREGTSQILEYPIEGDELDHASEREVLRQDHPKQIHNGGTIAFGPDGFLYVGFGDGGGRPSDAKRVASLEHWDGKVLRIDPTGADDGEYLIPPDNPFVDDEAARPEIWLRGLRNPFRFSFDSESGDLWVGDVGESCYEEIDRVPAGSSGIDLGFPAFEGRHEFLGGDAGATELPVYSYRHGPGCAVISGVVVRDRSLPELDGALVFADFCAGGVRALRIDGGRVQIQALDSDLAGVFGFGTGPDGGAYVMSTTGVYRITSAR